MKIEGKDNYGNPNSDYVAKIAAMSDWELFEETKNKIWLSAYASNNPRSDYHWQADACYDECKNRGQHDLYQRAYDYNVKTSA